MARHCPSRSLGAWVALAAWLSACTPPPVARQVEMVPIGTVPVVDRGPEVEHDAGGHAAGREVASAPSPAPSTPPLAPRAVKEGPCVSADVEALDDLLKRCEAGAPRAADIPTGLRAKLDVRLTSSTPSTMPGGRVDLQLVLHNRTNEPLTLTFVGEGGPRFVVEAVDARGKRVDRPAGKAPRARTAPPSEKASRVTLLANGVARLRLAWDAQKTRWAPERVATWDGRGGYPLAPAGALPPGRYVLRVPLPLLGFSAKDADAAKIPIDVGG